MADTSPLIVKANGEREPFEAAKLDRSLKRAGADEKTRADIVAHIEARLREGMTTGEIYEHAFAHLKDDELPIAARYSLKRALLSLGPTGFPFEEFAKELLAARGSRARTGVMAEGKCATHEVDVLACGGEGPADECIGVEAKFHNSLGIKSDLKVVLYVDARFKDLAATHERAPMEGGERITRGWLITNTKFTRDAIRYSECAGLSLVGWNYPPEHNLQDFIEEAGVHPVTCLSTLSEEEKKRLLEDNIVLCRAILHDKRLLAERGVSERDAARALTEARDLCGM